VHARTGCCAAVRLLTARCSMHMHLTRFTEVGVWVAPRTEWQAWSAAGPLEMMPSVRCTDAGRPRLLPSGPTLHSREINGEHVPFSSSRHVAHLRSEWPKLRPAAGDLLSSLPAAVVDEWSTCAGLLGTLHARGGPPCSSSLAWAADLVGLVPSGLAVAPDSHTIAFSHCIHCGG
jgi:hypothetical protein